MSLDKYYWPCTSPPNASLGSSSDLHVLAPKPPPACNKTTGLPYIRHDGYTNPEIHLYDHDGLIDVTMAVIGLGIGYYFTDNEDYAAQAANLLDTFFLNPATKMNPNLNFGHFIPGVVNGSHGAIIDSHYFPEMLDAVALISLSKSWSSSRDMALKSWFSDLLTWFRESPLGKQEDAAINNHGVWYDVQAGYIALHVGKNDIAKQMAQAAIAKRVEKQIQPDGELPQELARADSWSYSEFCVDAFVHLALFSNWSAVDLWHASNSLLRKALDFQLPFIQQVKKWPYPQVDPFVQGCAHSAVTQCIGSYFNVLRISANAYANSTYESTIKTLPDIDYNADRLNLLFPKMY